MLFDVPDRLGGLAARLGFRATKANPKNWYRLFDPAQPGSRDAARQAVAELRAAGIAVERNHWREVEAKEVPKAPRKRANPTKTRAATYRGHIDFSVPNVAPRPFRSRRKRP